MKSLTEEIKYNNNDLLLEKYYKRALEDETFKKLVISLGLEKNELMKYTSLLEKSANELKKCACCKNILSCKNDLEGYVYYPSVFQDNLTFNYVPCKYRKKIEEESRYQKNLYLFDMPKEIRNASMKDIRTDDVNRVPIIKWIKKFLDNYIKGTTTKGLYLSGSFGSGKTYLIAAMLNELAKNGKEVAIIYFPEFLRSLKSSFKDEDEFNQRFNYIKKVPLLLIDDIGAEPTTEWGRDEILGTILQYRMQEELPTFFTSNFNLKELEEHLSMTSKSMDKVKARRIMERIKQLTEYMELVGVNRRNENE